MKSSSQYSKKIKYHRLFESCVFIITTLLNWYFSFAMSLVHTGSLTCKPVSIKIFTKFFYIMKIKTAKLTNMFKDF